MTLEDVKKIEKELDIKLPERYIEVVLDNPLLELKTELFHTNVLDDPDEVIKLNRKFREKGYQKKRWRNHFFVIGYIQYPDKAVGKKGDKEWRVIDLKSTNGYVYSLMTTNRTHYKDLDYIDCPSTTVGDIFEFVECNLSNAEVIHSDVIQRKPDEEYWNKNRHKITVYMFPESFS